MPLDHFTPSRLEQRLRREIRGEVLFDAFSRGRYATDASIYQIEPLGRRRAEEPRGCGGGDRDRARGGGAGVAARRRHLAMRADGGAGAGHRLQQISRPGDRGRCRGRRARVEPGVVLDRLNRLLRKDRLFFPVDPSTASRATIGGMTANNSCGSRSLRYGNMVHNVRGVDALLADGTQAWFGEVPGNFDDGGDARALPRAGAAACAPCTGARPTRSSGASRRCCGGSAATTSTASTTPATTWRGCWSAPRARSPSSTRSSSNCSRSRRTGCSASAISRASTARWPRPGGSSSWGRARSSWSTAR